MCWPDTCTYSPTMKTASKYRRTPAARWVPLALALVSLGQIVVAQDTDAQSLAVIRTVAQSYVKSLIPGSAGDITVTVGQLDSRLRLANCPAKDLSASLPAG